MKEEVEIEYLKRTISVTKSNTFQEFISQLVNTFFIIPKFIDSISLTYFDDDDDEIEIDKDNYSNCINEAKKIYLKIVKMSKKEEEEDEDNNHNNPIEDIKIKLGKATKEFTIYKKNIIKLCEKKIKDELDKVNDKHKKELDKLTNIYNEKLKKIKEKGEKQIEEILNKLEEESISLINKKVKDYNYDIEKEIQTMSKDKEGKFQNLDKIDFNSLNLIQNELSKLLGNENENDIHEK